MEERGLFIVHTMIMDSLVVQETNFYLFSFRNELGMQKLSGVVL